LSEGTTQSTTETSAGKQYLPAIRAQVSKAEEPEQDDAHPSSEGGHDEAVLRVVRVELKKIETLLKVNLGEQVGGGRVFVFREEENPAHALLQA